VIGVDVGGANLKVVRDTGVAIHYCPLWKESPIRDILAAYEGEEAAVVMSGELADGFCDKTAGIAFIVDAVCSVLPGAQFYGTDGLFHAGATPALAAANWLASADYLRELYPNAVLVDMGSTTTDIVPLGQFDDLKGMTDLDRLKAGYLVYTGMLRTTVPALLREVAIDGVKTLVASEHFAASADVHLALGHISEDEYTVQTADGAANDRASSLQRLSRVVCSDYSEIGEANALSIATGFWEEQKNLICSRVEAAYESSGASEVVVAGIGSRLLEQTFGWHDLRRDLGEQVDALPAYAVREVATRTGLF